MDIEEERRRIDKILEYYRENQPATYTDLQRLKEEYRKDESSENLRRYKEKKAQMINDYDRRNRARLENPNYRGVQNSNEDPYKLVVPSDLSTDQASAIGIKTKIEKHILEKLSDYIISNHPKGSTDTNNAYTIAIINVLRNIFKDPNKEIETYIEKRLNGESEKPKPFSFFGFGGTKRKRRKRRKSHRR